MLTAIALMPEQLRRSLTWDQGSEMSNHAQITIASGLDIYFCDPTRWSEQMTTPGGRPAPSAAD